MLIRSRQHMFNLCFHALNFCDSPCVSDAVACDQKKKKHFVSSIKQQQSFNVYFRLWPPQTNLPLWGKNVNHELSFLWLDQFGVSSSSCLLQTLLMLIKCFVFILICLCGLIEGLCSHSELVLSTWHESFSLNKVICPMHIDRPSVRPNTHRYGKLELNSCFPLHHSEERNIFLFIIEFFYAVSIIYTIISSLLIGLMIAAIDSCCHRTKCHIQSALGYCLYCFHILQ